LVNKKEEKILQLEQTLLNSRHDMEKEWILKLSKLQTEFDQLKFQNVADIQIRNAQIDQLQLRITQIQKDTDIEGFRKEAREINALLAQ